MLKLPSPIVQPEEYKKSLSTIVSRFSVPIVVVGSVFAFWILSQLLATILLGSAALAISRLIGCDVQRDQEFDGQFELMSVCTANADRFEVLT